MTRECCILKANLIEGYFGQNLTYHSAEVSKYQGYVVSSNSFVRDIPSYSLLADQRIGKITQVYPAWDLHTKSYGKLAIEIVDFPMKNGDFPMEHGYL